MRCKDILRASKVELANRSLCKGGPRGGFSLTLLLILRLGELVFEISETLAHFHNFVLVAKYRSLQVGRFLICAITCTDLLILDINQI